MKKGLKHAALVLGAHYVRNGNVMCATANEEVAITTQKKGQKNRGRNKVYLAATEQGSESEEGSTKILAGSGGSASSPCVLL
jgi:hypothetical protein